jgi:hypothetical protein
MALICVVKFLNQSRECSFAKNYYVRYRNNNDVKEQFIKIPVNIYFSLKNITFVGTAPPKRLQRETAVDISPRVTEFDGALVILEDLYDGLENFIDQFPNSFSEQGSVVNLPEKKVDEVNFWSKNLLLDPLVQARNAVVLLGFRPTTIDHVAVGGKSIGNFNLHWFGDGTIIRLENGRMIFSVWSIHPGYVKYSTNPFHVATRMKSLLLIQKNCFQIFL